MILAVLKSPLRLPPQKSRFPVRQGCQHTIKIKATSKKVRKPVVYPLNLIHLVQELHCCSPDVSFVTHNSQTLA